MLLHVVLLPHLSPSVLTKELLEDLAFLSSCLKRARKSVGLA